jgi:exopolysaccharide/PEP-CTERM locus tyrosine autokinase
MTLVERAIEKLRRTAAEQRQNSESRTVGSLVVEAQRTADPGAPPPPPERRIAVDREALREAGYLPETSVDRRFADHYRQIKRPLISAALAAPEAVPGSPRLIMMASALPGDGKTFTSINLALSMARERDVSVVLVDSDTPKPHVSRIFGVDSEPGLLEALGDSSTDVESLVLPTDVGGLSILPAGKTHDGATELLASARMSAVVTRLIARNPRRIVLFDSPPLLVSSESRALSSIAGQVVLVVRSGTTPNQAVLDALEQLGDRPVALILNQGRVSLTGGYYGYGTYGGYGDAPRHESHE